MYVATVIPIARGIPFDTLTYYCSEELKPGTLVHIPFRKQIISGITTESLPLTEAKSLVKSASFTLKKVHRVIGHLSYFEHVMYALQATATESIAPLGTVAGSVMPQFLFEYIQSEKLPALLSASTIVPRVFEEHVSIGTMEERADHYKRLVRSAFAAKKSIFVVAPTIRALEQWSTVLSKGIAKHTVILHSKVTKKNLRTAFAVIKSSEHPLLVFVTPGFFLTPRFDMGYLIVENESSTLYKTNDRYAVDTRRFIRTFAQHAGLDLTWGDTIPRLETLERLHAQHLPRSYVPDKLHVVSIEPYKTVLPSEVMELIRHAEKKKYKLFIYTNRKGVAPLSRCADCGTVVLCPTCTLPVVLRNRLRSDGTRERYFICTHCTDELPATYTCLHCGSWNITPLAIGTESVRDEVVSLVGESNVYAIDDDLVSDNATIEKMIQSLRQKKFAVVVGTTKFLPYLKNINYTIVPYFDRLLSIPSISTIENVLRLVMECNEHSRTGVVICTRTPDFPFIKKLETQKINAIIDEELTLRRELGYPPYGTLVKVSITVPEGYRQKIRPLVDNYFSAVDATALPPRRISPGSMKVLLVWIIKSHVSYIEEEGSDIARFLDTLRFPYKIEQNPERF